jgi:cold shock CspA family protein
VSVSERTPEPSYFQRPSPVAKDPVDAEVIWFNASKGFGFVKLADGTEVYLHARALEAAGSRGISEGTRLKLTVEDSPRGQQVSQVLEIGDQVAKTPLDARRTAEPTGETGAQPKSPTRSNGTTLKKALASSRPIMARRTSSFMPARCPDQGSACWWKDRRWLSNAGPARRAWKSGAFAWPRRQPLVLAEIALTQRKSPLPGGGGSGLDLKCGAGGGAPHSASASHLGGVNGRQQDHTESRRYCNAQFIYRTCEKATVGAPTDGAPKEQEILQRQARGVAKQGPQRGGDLDRAQSLPCRTVSSFSEPTGRGFMNSASGLVRLIHADQSAGRSTTTCRS